MKERTPERFGMRLKAERKKKHLSQAALAEQLGVSREYVARLEAGVHDPPLSTVVKLAKLLKVKVSKLVE